MNLFKSLLDLIYPPRCHICQAFLPEPAAGTRSGAHFCEVCLQGFVPLTSPCCPICSRPFSDGVQEDHVCEPCIRKRPFFQKAKAPYLYEEGLMEAIHQFKYAGKNYLSESLGELLREFAAPYLSNRESGPFLIMPVPLHPKRLRERGFNQSLLLARQVAQLPDLELDFLSLRRIRYTKPQTGLSGPARRKNVRRAFGLVGRTKIKGRDVILVDDVITTGNTLNECARVLKKGGARSVWGLVLARAAKH